MMNGYYKCDIKKKEINHIPSIYGQYREYE